MPVPGARLRTEPLPIELGGTGERSREKVRENLDVPSLSGDNTFTGDMTITAAATSGLTVNAPTNLNGQVSLTAELISNTGGEFAVLVVTETTRIAGLRVGYVAKTADYTLANTDLVCDVTSGSPTITLPTAGLGSGTMFIIKNSGAGTVTLATTSSQTIDGAAPGTVAAGGVIRLVSTGANWISV